jgi:hypothetical protein
MRLLPVVLLQFIARGHSAENDEDFEEVERCTLTTCADCAFLPSSYSGAHRRGR